MIFSYCPRCGSSVPRGVRGKCPSCTYEFFHNARPTASLIILDDSGERFLALKRAREPKAGLWETPGGFCDGPEHPADAARREAREELGVDVELGEFVGMYIGDYEFQDEMLTVLDCFWLATIPAGQTLVIDRVEASEMAWVPVVGAPEMAFSAMDRALADAAQILLKKGSPGE